MMSATKWCSGASGRPVRGSLANRATRVYKPQIPPPASPPFPPSLADGVRVQRQDNAPIHQGGPKEKRLRLFVRYKVVFAGRVGAQRSCAIVVRKVVNRYAAPRAGRLGELARVVKHIGLHSDHVRRWARGDSGKKTLPSSEASLLVGSTMAVLALAAGHGSVGPRRLVSAV